MRLLQIVWSKVSHIGYSNQLSDYEKKRLIIFNNLNFTGFSLAVVRYLYTLINAPVYFTYQATFLNLIIIAVFILVALLIHLKYYKIATITSFLVVPALITISCSLTGDSGSDMYLMLYMILSFFFFHRIKNIVFAFTYFLLIFIYLRINFLQPTELATKNNILLYYNLLNYLSALSVIFFTLYLIKFQVWNYEKSIREKKEIVTTTNAQLIDKTKKIEEQTASLQQKNIELTELNHLKVKLFSIISHDVRTSVYALKNIMTAFEKGSFSKEQMMASLPGVNNEVDKCVELIDNLLVWARNQLNESNIIFQNLDLRKMTDNTYKLFSRKAAEKKIKLINKVTPGIVAYADVDMMKAILRNLVGNAIKFTQQHGHIEIFTERNTHTIKLIVMDNGIGITEEGLTQIFSDKYYTTLGTSKEMGTGLGLMICRDFVKCNNGDFKILSKPKHGSSFIITLPVAK